MEVTVHTAEVGPDGHFRLATEVTDEDGVTRNVLHWVHAEAVEWRMAQFNVDQDTAVQAVVAEPYVDEGDPNLYDLKPRRSLARAAKVEAMEQCTVSFQSGEPPQGLGPRPDAIVDSGVGCPKAFIKEQAPIDDAMIEAKREVLDKQRAELRESLDEIPAPPTEGIPQARRRSVDLFREMNDLPPRTPTTVVEQPSELANRLIEKRLEMVRSFSASDDNGASPGDD